VSLTAGERRPVTLDALIVADVRKSLDAQRQSEPDFWSVAGVTTLHCYEAIASRTLTTAVDTLLEEYGVLHTQISRASYWRSVLDQLYVVVGDPPHLSTASETRAAARLVAQLSAYVAAAT
jgi:vacuolar-type H+-ATPase catalytic subunit A/Vma1